jgi:hypothetical protein
MVIGLETITSVKKKASRRKLLKSGQFFVRLLIFKQLQLNCLKINWLGSEMLRVASCFILSF